MEAGRWFSFKSCAIGLAAGLLVAISVAANQTATPAAATGPVGRYQLQTWAFSGYGAANGPQENGQHGAYRIDTVTGEVMAIEQGGATRVQFP
jgi:hypothetical protein